jgi:hypothetical protein
VFTFIHFTGAVLLVWFGYWLHYRLGTRLHMDAQEQIKRFRL